MPKSRRNMPHRGRFDWKRKICHVWRLPASIPCWHQPVIYQEYPNNLQIWYLPIYLLVIFNAPNLSARKGWRRMPQLKTTSLPNQPQLNAAFWVGYNLLVSWRIGLQDSDCWNKNLLQYFKCLIYSILRAITWGKPRDLKAWAKVSSELSIVIAG